MLTTILAITITLKLWHLLAIISVVTFFIAISMEDTGGYIPLPVYTPIWLFWNLVGWLVYFIIV